MGSKEDRAITLISIAVLVLVIILLAFVSVLVFDLYRIDYSHVRPSVVVNFDHPENCRLIKIPYEVKVPYENSYVRRIGYLDYSSRSMQRRVTDRSEDLVDEYIVYVDNSGHSDEYFEVEFIFRDYNGREHSYLVGKEVEANEEGRFIYRDTHTDKDKHYDFSYRVLGSSRRHAREVVRIDYIWETKYKWQEVCL